MAEGGGSGYRGRLAGGRGLAVALGEQSKEAKMKDSTIKMLFAGALVLGGLLAAVAVTLTGMILRMPIAELVALQVPFVGSITGGTLFFLGHSNGTTRRNGG